jgi:hypothetical protein
VFLVNFYPYIVYFFLILAFLLRHFYSCSPRHSSSNAFLTPRRDWRFKRKSESAICSFFHGSGSIFTVWKWAQSIPHLGKPKNRWFSHKNPKIFDFRFNTPISLNQGQGSVFKARECAQSISRIEKPKNWWFSHKIVKCLIFASIRRFLSWIRVKEAFLRFGSARNRFPA